MSTQITPTKPFQFDEQAVKTHFGKIEELVNKLEGKKGYNPFIWLEQNVNKLADRFRGYVEPIYEEKIINGLSTNVKIKEIKHPPERTETLQKAILAIPLEIPALELSVDENPTEYNIHQQRPQGLNLPQRQF